MTGVNSKFLGSGETFFPAKPVNEEAELHAVENRNQAVQNIQNTKGKFMEQTYQLTEKEQKIIETYREVGEAGQTFIEIAASSSLKLARSPKPTAQVIEFSTPKTE